MRREIHGRCVGIYTGNRIVTNSFLAAWRVQWHTRDMRPSRFLNALRSLVSDCERSAEVLHQAAERVTDPSLKPMLDVYALRRDFAVAQLSATLAELGATPTVASGWSSALHEGAGDRAIVDACERSETKTLARLQRMFQHQMPQAAQRTLERCFEEMRAVCNLLQGYLQPRPQLSVA
jgi:hypothetical protein